MPPNNTTTDTLHLIGIKLPTTIGVHPFEKAITQTLLADVTLPINCTTVAEKDEIKHTLDYDALTQWMQTFAKENQFALIETFAEKITAACLAKFNLAWITLTLHKPHALGNQASDVCVNIHRQRR